MIGIAPVERDAKEPHPKDIVIALDRLVAKIRAAHLDPDHKDDAEKIEKLVEHVAAHELGHNLGLEDNAVPNDLMNGDAPSFIDDTLTSIMRSDIDEAEQRLRRRAI
ncbi:MAG: matrixin family metalloprotease [Gemmatimonadaceae bacterium]|nr:matrixin family metalloprotease [Gemmatimonadaceae bacterium]